MPQTPYKIFVSSTTEDLVEYRKAVVGAVQRLGHLPVVLEFMQASSQSPAERSFELIASCDAFISLIAFRYGFVPPLDNPHGYSFVELELRYAWDLGKPTYVFMVSDQTPWPPQFFDHENLDRLNKFRATILDRRIVSFFNSPQELTEQVLQALATMPSVIEESRRSPVDVAMPTTVDQFELAWRLVVDRKAEPALLASMDAAGLLRATQQWAREMGPDQPLDGPGLFEAAQAQLRSKQSPLAPSPLWLAWKRAAGLGPAPTTSNG
jgi:hypothetical protein